MGLKKNRLTEGPHMGKTLPIHMPPSTTIPWQQLEYRLPELSHRQKKKKKVKALRTPS